MFRPRIIPTLLLLDRGLVKTVRFKSPTYLGDPINAVKIFNDLKADELVFLDITATKESRLPPLDLLREISEEAFMPFAAGGGIKSIEDAKKIVGSGAEKIVINSASVSNPSLISQIADHFGAQSLIVSIDVKKNFWGKYKVCTEGGRKMTDLEPDEHAANMEKHGAGEILINSIDMDGTMTGFDLELIKLISGSVKIPVIGCGGAGTLADLNKAITIGGASAVAAGSMFVFQGPRRAVLINYPEPHELHALFQ